MAPILSGQNCKFCKVSFVSQFQEKNTKKILPNIEVDREDLGAMLEN